MAGYPGKSDIALPKVAPGQPYGAAGAQRAALRAVPPAQQDGALGEPQPVGLDQPSMLPHEPVTAGAPIGPGAGPEAIPPSIAPSADPVRQQLAALYRVNPNPDLQRLLELLDAQGR